MEDNDIIVLDESQPNSITVTDTLTLDFDFGSTEPALSTTGFDTITINDITSMTNTISLPTTSLNISNGGGGGTYTTTATGYTWNQSFSPAVNIDNHGLNIKEGGDIKIGGKSLSEVIDKIEQRLGILKPNPELEDRWEQLKELRKQYIELEKDLLEKEKIMKILKET